MSLPDPADVTQLLVAWRDGDPTAFDRLMPLVYEHLHTLARQHMRREREGHSLQSTALVHEAYLRLVDSKRVAWQDRAHFFAVAARVMRRILVDAARKKAATKRGGTWYVSTTPRQSISIGCRLRAQTEPPHSVRWTMPSRCCRRWISGARR